MLESSLTDQKPSLANSHFYVCFVDLLAVLQRVMWDDRQTNDERSDAAKSVYERLTAEISRSVMDKLETGDEAVVSRLETFLLCLTGKCSVPADRKNAEKLVRFVSEQSGEAESTSTADDEEPLTVESESSQGMLFGCDPARDDRSPLWRLISDSCWLSYHCVRSQSSSRHLGFLAAILRSNTTDQLLKDLMARAELWPTSAASVHRDFLEQMVLPLVDKFGDHEGSRHILSVMSLIYAQLQPDEQVLVAREITDRAARNLICANFLGDIISSKESSDEVRRWVRGDEFGRFVVELTDDVCRRQLMTTKSSEVPDESMVNDQSMDDSHWKLLCACLRVDHKSGLLSLTCSITRGIY